MTISLKNIFLSPSFSTSPLLWPILVCIAPRSFVTLSPSGATFKRTPRGGENLLYIFSILSVSLCFSLFHFALLHLSQHNYCRQSLSFHGMGLTSREEATYHPLVFICRLAKPFWHDVTRDVNRKHRTAMRKKREEGSEKKKENETPSKRGGVTRNRGKERKHGVWIRRLGPPHLLTKEGKTDDTSFTAFRSSVQHIRQSHCIKGKRVSGR